MRWLGKRLHGGVARRGMARGGGVAGEVIAWGWLEERWHGATGGEMVMRYGYKRDGMGQL